MSSFTGCDPTIFFCKIGKDHFNSFFFQKLTTSVILKSITDVMNLYISVCWKAY